MHPTSRKFWRNALFTAAGAILAFAVCFEAYRRLTQYGAQTVQAHPVDARVEMANPPPWLDRRIVHDLLEEAYSFARRDWETFDRVRNTLDSDILRQIAELYTGVESLDRETRNRQALGYNAWIRRVTQVRRQIAKDRSFQTIEVFAEWRKPSAWVRVGELYYLVDEQGIRLPQTYTSSDRAGSPLMVVTGIALPTDRGVPQIAQPGEPLIPATDASAGQDLFAGLKLAGLLQNRPYARQIDALDLSNFEGRRDAGAPWIVLQTIWRTSSGSPRLIHWGRPVDREEFYEVNSSSKLKSLEELYLRFSRIDADRDCVDIRDDVLRLSRSAALVAGA